ncbi:putative F-box/FBD/LRR-repeat protein At4g03220 [Impatiens glandulifera]|uniref:putative F-box/FBD/LRR-repeat protein At4g03220 n=1 Tax=Impatiens glandulifera TaxID=253017 RepID=UPI001FB098D0|nr:putative F-box/FBD/LRR-repeat protein At4g03220 [Impatiens glandulifera]
MNLNEYEHEGLNKEDRISQLPDHIIHDILRFLPIKSAAQTIILSKRWKSLFSSIPYLNFTTMELQTTSSVNSSKDINFINNVFNFRDNNASIRTLKLKSFVLSSTVFNCLTNYPNILNIEELEVNLKTREENVYIPSNIINYKSLRVLRLNILCLDLKLTQPLMLKNREFKLLHTMILSQQSFLMFTHHDNRRTLLDIFTDSSFPYLKKLILESCYNLKELNVRCSELKDLVIKNCFQLRKLDIYGLKLERLNVENCFDYISIVNIRIIAPVMKILKWVDTHSTQIPVLEKSYLLEEAVIGLLPSDFDFDNYIIEPAQIQSLSNMITAISHAKFLKFKFQSIEIFSRNDDKQILVNKFERLRKLEICIEYYHFNGYNNLLAIATLFKNSPYLETLVIKNTLIKCDRRLINGYRKKRMRSDSSDDKYWKRQIPEMSSFLNHLRRVKLNGFLECEKDISLVKFLLKNGKVLEEIVLCFGLDSKLRYESRRKMKHMVMRWRRASCNARVVFK